MKKFVLIALFLASASVSQAQQFYFAYLQTENKQAFYVKINEKLLSSSNSGYLVIPKLVTGNYPLTIGFAKDKWPQQQFNIAINTNDEGFIIKNFGEKGWGLYNIQTMQISMNGKESNKVISNEEDVFASKLLGATNASNVEVKKTETSSNKSTLIKKITDVKNNFGRFMRYTINTSGKTDTVDVNIEYADDIVKTQTVAATNPDIVIPANAEKPKPEKFLKIDMATDNSLKLGSPTDDSIKTTSHTKTFITKHNPTVNFNSDCKLVATDDDFYKTRKKMAMEDNDDDMVEVAKKLFKQKCYTVAQVKDLSIIFMSDNGKYKFFDVAYPFITDTQNFSSLEQQLKDNYYINRFKAMIKD